MKQKENKPEIIYRIINKKTGNSEGSYSRDYCDEFDFNSVYQARTTNCHNVFCDEEKYKISKYRVVYELIEDDCQVEEENKENYEAIKKKLCW